VVQSGRRRPGKIKITTQRGSVTRRAVQACNYGTTTAGLGMHSSHSCRESVAAWGEHERGQNDGGGQGAVQSAVTTEEAR